MALVLKRKLLSYQHLISEANSRGPPVSYAKMASSNKKDGPKRERETLIIRTQDSEKSLEQIVKKVNQDIIKESITIKDVRRPTKKLIIMKFDSKEEQQKTKELIDSKKIADCETQIATKLDLTIRFTNIHDLSEEQLSYSILRITGKQPVNINVVQRARSRKAFVRLKGSDYQENMNKSPNVLFSGLYRLRYDLFVFVLKCQQYYQMGHTAARCRNKDDIKAIETRKEVENSNKCADCIFGACKDKYSNNLEVNLKEVLKTVDHYSFDSKCVTYNRLYERTLRKYNL